MLMALILVLTSMVSAEDLYQFTLSEGAAISEDADTWYLKLSAPAVSGMAVAEEQSALNQYFLSYINQVYEEYEDDKAYFTENYDGTDKPHFGYEYWFSPVCENDDYFVFRTSLFYAAGSSMTVNEYWTLDKHSGRLASLGDLADAVRLGEISDYLIAAMRVENKNGASFWVDDLDIAAAFSYAEEYHHWYVNEDGNLVFTFDKYEIAPGAMGESKFEIVNDHAVLLKDNKYSFELTDGDHITEENEHWSLDLVVPVVSGMEDKAAEEELNKHFSDYAAGIKSDFEDMRSTVQASIDAGGNPHFSYQYSYKVLTDTDDVFAFQTEKLFVAASGTSTYEFWNLDKNTGLQLKWSDVVPDGAMQTIHDLILAEMISMNANGSGAFYTNDNSLDAALKTVPSTNSWYLNSDGDLVIVFDKYEVAVGVMGNPQFVIDRAKLSE